PRFQKLARATGDPWFVLLAAEQSGRALRESGSYGDAEAELLAAVRRCDEEGIDYRCARLELELGELYLSWHRPADALRVITSGMARARRSADWAAEERFLGQRGELALVSDDVSAAALSAARPYLEEIRLRAPEDCQTQVFAREIEATLLVNQL